MVSVTAIWHRWLATVTLVCGPARSVAIEAPVALPGPGSSSSISSP
jgi:hypothetical protein